MFFSDKYFDSGDFDTQSLKVNREPIIRHSMNRNINITNRILIER